MQQHAQKQHALHLPPQILWVQSASSRRECVHIFFTLLSRENTSPFSNKRWQHVKSGSPLSSRREFSHDSEAICLFRLLEATPSKIMIISGDVIQFGTNPSRHASSRCISAHALGSLEGSSVYSLFTSSLPDNTFRHDAFSFRLAC